MPKEQTQLEIMQEILVEDMAVLNELLQEDVMPLIQYRKSLEEKIGNKEINDLYKLEEEAR